MSPQATYHGGDFDFVDMATGRLNLHIPLVVDHSQRGKLNFTNSLTYTSTGTWGYAVRSLGWWIEPPKYGVGSIVLSDGSLSGLMKQFWHDSDYGVSASTWSLYEGGWGVGTLHPLGWISGSPSCDNTMESVDGSGIRASCVSTPTVIWTVTDKKGIQYSPNRVDANGNTMTGGVDTLGRTWTPASYSSNVTGCPTGGPVAPTSSTIWTIPGPANTVRTFKFCYSAINDTNTIQ
jgi:hypothetical protein